MMALSLLIGVSMGGAGIEALHAQAKPPVFVVSENSVSDIDAYLKEYVPLAQASIKAAGGHLVAASANAVSFEGAPPAKRIAINQFDSLERAQAWRNSAQYKDARKVGDKYATFRAFAVEGVAQ